MNIQTFHRKTFQSRKIQNSATQTDHPTITSQNQYPEQKKNRQYHNSPIETPQNQSVLV